MDREQEMQAYFDDLMDHHYRAVRAYLKYLCGCQDLADDLTQEVFGKTWQYLLAEKEIPDNWRAWLRTVAFRLALDYFESSARPRQHLNIDYSDPLDRVPAILDQLAATEIRRRVREAVVRLEARQRLVVIWRMKGCTTKTIHAKLKRRGLPASKKTIERLWQKARQCLQEALADCYDG